MKRIRKTSMAITLSLLAATFTGCSQGSGPAPAGKEAPAAAGSKEPVKFTVLLRAGSEFDPQNNPWVQEINKRANADITWMVVPIANVWEKRNVLMASGDYPEVIIMNTPNDNLYAQMVKNKVLLPVDNLLKDAPNIMKYSNKASLDAVRDPDGHMYQVPRSTIVREDFMGIRKDWREKLGLPVPKTTDDWRAFYKAVATQDPDGNGKADTYGVTESSELMALSGTINLEYFARAWHADKQWYDNGSGEVFFGVFAKDGRFKQALEFYRQLAQDKSLDPDLITNKGIAAKEDKFNKGVTGSMRMFAGKIDSYLNVMRKIHPTAQVELVDFPTAPNAASYSKEKLVSTNSGLYNTWALTTKAKGKEKEIIRVFDWMLSDEGWNILKNGVEGVHYKKEGDKLTYLEPEYGNFSKWIGHAMMFRRPNDEDLWLKKLVPDVYSYQKEWLDKSIKYVPENYQEKGLLGLVSDKEADFYKKDVYTKKFIEVTAQIIYGDLPLTAWDDFLKEVYAAGWEEVTREYNAYYASHK
ncbi:extracellular solute-binding protein [Paenibacillus sp. UNCCL117]|uniref:extracellular solute-binding protein n=1 Tax=unclassified Paenibacillus TaxID=185978 RepID=UPI0008819611|nr:MULTISPECIES: extracellular solute-binding protein [unclassified Paenibacillus]SDD90506.1 extracellular solute-binding protein [Paenibacillus sp. cl123]SFW43906.1 extracellular solute-binding protein [Paenibacillus sp. UNCCL117]